MGCSPSKCPRIRRASEKLPQIKIVLLGNTAVGKTSIMKRFCLGSFQEEYEVSIGGSFQQKAVELAGKTTVLLNIWDTAGQERFKSLMPLYFRDAQAALIVFDLTDPESLKSCEYWLSEVKKSRGEECLIGLVGNKQDAPMRRVSYDAVEPILKLHSIEYFETSAKTNSNIDMVFERIATKLIKAPDYFSVIPSF